MKWRLWGQFWYRDKNEGDESYEYEHSRLAFESLEIRDSKFRKESNLNPRFLAVGTEVIVLTGAKTSFGLSFLSC